MTLLTTCNACSRKGLFTRRRTYVVPRYFGDKPITSVNPLCGKCYRGIKRKLNIK